MNWWQNPVGASLRSHPDSRIARLRIFRCAWLCVLVILPFTGRADDWPMLGRDNTRNRVSPEKGAPVEWDQKRGRNIKWIAPLGSMAVAEPVVAGGLVWIGTNNEKPLDDSQKTPGGVLACFRERDGAFLYQYLSVVTNKSPGLARRNGFGMTGAPMAEGDHLWFVSPAAEIICLNTAGLRRGDGNSETVWSLDMVDKLDVYPAVDVMGGKGMCSIGASFQDWIHVITGNGTDWTHVRVPSPSAPALVCLNKRTGALVWEDHSPGTAIVDGEFASPLVMEIGGVAQVIAPQGDGWVRAFEAGTGQLLWKFDINPKSSKPKYEHDYFLNSPVYHGGHVYIARGRSVEQGEGPGRLVCVDPTKRGDLSLELEDEPGVGKPNPNSGVVWHFDEIGHMISEIVIDEGLLVATDLTGFVYCLDAATGRQLWKHDARARYWGSALIVDGKIYVGDEDGYVHVLKLAREKELLFSASFDAPIFSSPVFANGVLYLATTEQLYAIQQGARSPPPSKRPRP